MQTVNTLHSVISEQPGKNQPPARELQSTSHIRQNKSLGG